MRGERYRLIKATKLHLHILFLKGTKALLLLVKSTKTKISKLRINGMLLQNNFRKRVVNRGGNMPEQIKLEKIFAPNKQVREWDQKRRFFFNSSEISNWWETGQLASAPPEQVYNLITTPHFILFPSFQRFLHIVTSYYFDIFNFCFTDICLGEALPSFPPQAPYIEFLQFPHRFALLLLLLFPSLMFSIPTSSDLWTFTKIQETHKGIWGLLLKKKQLCSSMSLITHTHTEDPLHRLSKNVHHLNLITPSRFRHLSQIIENTELLFGRRSSFLLVSYTYYFFPLICFFSSHLSPWTLPSCSLIS